MSPWTEKELASGTLSVDVVGVGPWAAIPLDSAAIDPWIACDVAPDASEACTVDTPATAANTVTPTAFVERSV